MIKPCSTKDNIDFNGNILTFVPEDFLPWLSLSDVWKKLQEPGSDLFLYYRSDGCSPSYGLSLYSEKNRSDDNDYFSEVKSYYSRIHFFIESFFRNFSEEKFLVVKTVNWQGNKKGKNHLSCKTELYGKDGFYSASELVVEPRLTSQIQVEDKAIKYNPNYYTTDKYEDIDVQTQMMPSTFDTYFGRLSQLNKHIPGYCYQTITRRVGNILIEDRHFGDGVEKQGNIIKTRYYDFETRAMIAWRDVERNNIETYGDMDKVNKAIAEYYASGQNTPVL